jgi:two-component system invasion response regulator UvrY
MIRAFIADDHAIVRRGLRQIVDETSEIIVAGEASTGWEAIRELLKNHYDVVLLDITMPDLNGLDILKELKRQRPEIRVLMLSIHPEEQFAIRALKAGASGYLTKDSAPAELVGAIKKVAEGGRYVSASLGEKLASQLTDDSDKEPHETLADREYQIMQMIARGMSVQQIARELFLSASTVYTYRTRILRKLQVKNNAELIRYAADNRLL